MYAVIEWNNNQYIVKKDEEIVIDKLNEDARGKTLQINNVLFLKDKEKVLIGKPYLANVTVHAELVKDIKGEKITIIKYKRRKNYKRKQGHRQPYSVIKIKDITVK